jgi:hypothetical protein
VSGDGIAAIITAAGAIIITLFTYLQGRDFLNAMKTMVQPIQQAMSNAATGMAENNRLFARFAERQAEEISRLAAEQGASLRMLERLDERTSRLF